VTEGRLIKEEIPTATPPACRVSCSTARKPMFQDVRNISLLLDFEWTNKQLFNGAYTRTRSYFENSEMAAPACPAPTNWRSSTAARQDPGQVFTEAFEPGHRRQRHDPRASSARLSTAAGGRLEDRRRQDGRRHGKPVTIEFLLAQTEFERVLLPFKRNLADLGIDLVIRRVDVSQYINRVRSRDFDMIVGSFPQSTRRATSNASSGSSAPPTNPAAATTWASRTRPSTNWWKS
jgi:microcin C transport system substrate-binding protein